MVNTLLKSYTIAVLQSPPATSENDLNSGLGSATSHPTLGSVQFCAGAAQATNEIFNIFHVLIMKCFRSAASRQNFKSSLKALHVHTQLERQVAVVAAATLRMIAKLRATSILCACNELSTLQLFCLAFDVKLSAKIACD